jgi:hypothetical protein
MKSSEKFKNLPRHLFKPTVDLSILVKRLNLSRDPVPLKKQITQKANTAGPS